MEIHEPVDPPEASYSPWSRMGVSGRMAWLAVLVGLILRLWEYSSLRPLYDDEESLLVNLVGVPVFDFHHILKEDQVAPPGFLVIERILVRLPTSVRASGRLFPLLCGLASMLLIVPLARRYVARIAVPIAAWMLALSDHLIYYSAEIKQYSCDLVAAMAALLVAVPNDPAEPSRRRLAGLAALGLIAPWFSFPVAFILAGIGLHLSARRAIAKDWRGFWVAILICVAWLASFGGCFAVAHSTMSKRDFLRTWWGFAFLPIPPKDWADVQLVAETMANVFINPGSLLTPFGLPFTAILACGVALLGCASLGRRWAGGFFLLLAPLVFGLAGSALRQYPFHGRLIFFVVPTFHLLLVEGIAFIGRWTRIWVAILLAAVFLVGQGSDIVWNQMILMKRRHLLFDSHGDLKNDLLDHLEQRRSKARPSIVPKGPGRASRRLPSAASPPGPTPTAPFAQPWAFAYNPGRNGIGATGRGRDLMRFAIWGLGTALPEHAVSQERAAALSSRLSGHDEGQGRRLAALYRRSGVRRRHLAMLDRSEPEVPPEGLHRASTRWRMERYDELVRPLAREAAGKALAASGVKPATITHLVTVSCTGFSAPGFDLALIGGLGLDPGVQRTHVGFMGCHGALNGLRVARAFAGSEPGARVLLCAAELCALHFQEGWEADDAVANALFGDGAAAVVGGAGEGSDGGWRVAASGSYLLPDCGDAMSWNIGDKGFAMTLSPRVAPIIAEQLRPWLEGWLRPLGLGPEDVKTWAVHPGGPRIVDAVETALGLGREATAVSRDVLASCGNMSSPTILFILDRLRRQNAPLPCVALAFGPGLSIEAALFV